MMSLNLPPSTPAVNASAGTNPFSNFGTATSASSVPFSTTNTAFSNPFSSNATAVGANPFDTATPSFGAAAQPNTTSLATTTFQPSTTLLANTTSQPSTQTSSFIPTVTAQTTLTNNPQSNPLYILENLQLAYDPKSPYCKFKVTIEDQIYLQLNIKFMFISMFFIMSFLKEMSLDIFDLKALMMPSGNKRSRRTQIL